MKAGMDVRAGESRGGGECEGEVVGNGDVVGEDRSWRNRIRQDEKIVF